MLKHAHFAQCRSARSQPPSGGCVLKREGNRARFRVALAAAFGRLCVETIQIAAIAAEIEQPPSGGCVLKHIRARSNRPPSRAAAFGRLCVETTDTSLSNEAVSGSRLRAAVC